MAFQPTRCSPGNGARDLLALPAHRGLRGAAPAEAAPAAAAEGTHTIAAGDTLWDIAKKTYGAGSKWKTIADANPEIDADNLTVGTTLKIPPAS